MNKLGVFRFIRVTGARVNKCAFHRWMNVKQRSLLIPMLTATCCANQFYKEKEEQKTEERQTTFHVMETLQKRREAQRQKEEEKMTENQHQREKEEQQDSHSFRQEQRELQNLAIQSIRLIFALDFTSSSMELHKSGNNPYSEVIDVMGEVMKFIPGSQNFTSFAFGKDHLKLVNICRSGECSSFNAFQRNYQKRIFDVGGGDSCICSSVDEAVRVFKSVEPQHTVLFVITDGKLEEHTNLDELKKFPIALYFIVVDECDQRFIQQLQRTENFVGVIDYSKVRARDFFKRARQSNAKVVAAHYVDFMKTTFPIMQQKMASLSSSKC